MNKRHPYNSIIERKLEQLPAVNADQLWSDMHSILDKKMPQKKERRRFILWFLMSKPLLLLTVGFIIGTGTSLFFLATKNNSTTVVTNLPDAKQADKPNENSVVKKSDRINETIKPNIETPQENTQAVSATISFSNKIKPVANKVRANLRTNRTPEKNSIMSDHDKNQDNELVQSISIARPYFDITTVTLNSDLQKLFDAKNSVRENNFLDIQAESLAYNTKKDARINNEKGLYGGIISGIDLSSTNFKSVRTGSTRGFIMGYALNNRWSFESGLLWDTKRVYDKGANFDPPGYAPSGGITIMNVNGKSRIYEIPVNVKYNMITGEHGFFAATGLSSYIMRTENYDYEYRQNNQLIGHNYLSYKNETRNWFSVVNLTLGYTHKFGSLGNLRVEPYLKLPIKNIGVGKMPIMSKGLNIGFTRQIR